MQQRTIRLIIRASARNLWALRPIAERLCETTGSLLLRHNGKKTLERYGLQGKTERRKGGTTRR